MTKFYITSPVAISSATKKMVLTGTDSSGWIRTYKDQESGVSWKEYFPYDDDRSPAHMMRCDLPQPCDQLLAMVLSQGDEDDIHGLAAWLSSQGEVENVLQHLRAEGKRYKRSMLLLFGRYFSPKDKRNLLGMSVDEVSLSYQKIQSAIEEIKILTHNA